MSHEKKTATNVSAITFLLIVVFSLLCTLKQQRADYRPCQVLLGIMCPLMAIVAGTGTLRALQVMFHSMNFIVPFLILAIG